MKCSECNGEYTKVHGQYEVDDKYVGRYIVEAVDYYQCNECGNRLLPLKTAKRIEERRYEILKQWLQSQPLNAFISATETASILGISRQALHKHKRIRRGFIYCTTFGEKKVRLYLKNSVLQFKKTGDGRFPLRQLVGEAESVADIISAGRLPIYDWQSFPGKEMGLIGRVLPTPAFLTGVAVIGEENYDRLTANTSIIPIYPSESKEEVYGAQAV